MRLMTNRGDGRLLLLMQCSQRCLSYDFVDILGREKNLYLGMNSSKFCYINFGKIKDFDKRDVCIGVTFIL